MSYTLEVKEEANLEIIEAYVYYENQQPNLGERFLKQLEIYFERITQNPKMFARKRSVYREAFIRKFPYLIIYEIEEPKKIIVYSVFNARQDPERKPK